MAIDKNVFVTLQFAYVMMCLRDVLRTNTGEWIWFLLVLLLEKVVAIVIVLSIMRIRIYMMEREAEKIA